MADESKNLSGRVLGEFVLLERIGQGGHASVYRCEQIGLKRDVVVKVLRQRLHRNDASRERFLREARLASRLDHPYAAHIYAFGAESDGLLWLAMEYVHGTTLSGWLDKHGPMPLDRFVRFFGDLAKVVHALHESGIIHRDLKPSNVMVIERNGQVFPKLLDLGIAKLDPDAVPPGDRDTAPPSPSSDGTAASSLLQPESPGQTTKSGPPDDGRLTHTGAQMGSLPYMPPEQWEDAHNVGRAADIYSLGILIYEVLTGNRPFPGPGSSEYRNQHDKAPVPPLGKGFSRDLDRVIQRALAKTADRRYASVLELATALRAVQRAQPEARLHSVAQIWQDGRRRSSVLLTRKELASIPKTGLSKDASAVVQESRRRLAIRRWTWLGLGVTAVAIAIGVVWYRGELKLKTKETERTAEIAARDARAAQKLADVTVTQSELEQGRAALLHNEPEAASHLMAAYQRDPQPSTGFMLARALEPRLAEQIKFQSTSGRAWSSTFSPDGTQVAETDDGGAQIWDARTHVRRFVLPHGTETYLGVYSADSRWYVTAAKDAVRIWDSANGALLRKLVYPRKAGAPTDYFVVAISPDRRFIAAMDKKGSVADVWNAASAALLAERPIAAAGAPEIVFSANSRWLAATGGIDAHVFDTQTWQVASTIDGSGIRHLAFDPTGPRLLTGSVTGDVSLWAIPAATRTRHLRETGDAARSIAFSPDGQLVAAGFRGGTAAIWHATGELQSQINTQSNPIFALEFDRTSQFVLASVADGTVVIADRMHGMPVTVLEGSRSAPSPAHFDPSSRHVVAAGWDGSTHIWDASATYRQFSSPQRSIGCGVVTTSDPDRRFLAIGCRGQLTQVWDTANDRLVAELPAVSQVEGDFASAFPVVSAAGDRAAIARGNSVEIYGLPEGRLLNTIYHTAPVNAVAFSLTGTDLISGAIDGSLRVEGAGGSTVIPPRASAGIDAVGILPDRRLVAADAQRKLHFYDSSGRELDALDLPGRVSSLRSERDRLVTVPIVTNDGSPPALVDLEHDRVIAYLGNQGVRVFSSRWVPSHEILTSGSDGAVRRWNGTTGDSLQTYQMAGRAPYDADLTPEGWVIAGSNDGVIRFWDKTSGRLLWGLPAHASGTTGLHIEGTHIISHGFNGDLARWRLPDPAQTIETCRAAERCTIVPP